MLGTFTFDSVSSRARALCGKLRKAVLRKNSDDFEDEIEADCLPAGSSLNTEEFEAREVEVEEQIVKIYVPKPAMPAYFEESADYAPTIVGTVRPVEPVVASPVQKKEKFVASEPADLFLNALRRPVRQKVDVSAPVIKKKAAPATEEQPAVVAAEPVVEVPVVEAPVVVETPMVVEEPVVVEEVAVAEPVIVVEETVAEEIEVKVVEEKEVVSLLDAPRIHEEEIPMFDVLEAEEARIESEIAHEAMEAAPVAEPVTVVPALPRKIIVPELEPVAEETESVIPALENFGEVEMVPTSAEAMEAPICVPTFDVKEEVPVVHIVKEERDILFAFRPELAADEEEFVTTSYDNNLALHEDYLDETERTFKIRYKPQPFKFDGNFRNICRY